MGTSFVDNLKRRSIDETGNKRRLQRIQPPVCGIRASRMHFKSLTRRCQRFTNAQEFWSRGIDTDLQIVTIEKYSPPYFPFPVKPLPPHHQFILPNTIAAEIRYIKSTLTPQQTERCILSLLGPTCQQLSRFFFTKIKPLILSLLWHEAICILCKRTWRPFDYSSASGASKSELFDAGGNSSVPGHVLSDGNVDPKEL